jgi:hypothetical protein
MDNNYNWNNAGFTNRSGESLNLAANMLADVLHTLYSERGSTIPDFPSFQALTGAVLTVFVLVIAYKKAVRELRF